ncbi:Hypothetical predicted protein [Olea europaea subsp. europaea]|uniref:Ubiquitin-like protease family profile domain-containing protein n=1 Tax=Olea europaea subsp. europaea TaxID=158383 RepID=A0A8S0UNV0_OLEEU|nr:Hypothetical predicted protein [Olea europaea subsp. europaea]
MDAIKSQMSNLNSNQAKKITEIILMQGQLKCDMTKIRTNIQFLSEFVIAMISSSIDEILRRFNDRKGCPVNEYKETEAAVVGGEESHVVEKLQPVVDGKGKRKVDPTDDVAFPCSLQPPSFDLGIRYTQPDDLQFAEIQKQVNAIISDVITASKNVDEEGSPTPEQASELPVKQVSRPARMLRSPFVVGKGKHMDVCFYYIRQVAKFGKVKFRATMTDSWFQNKIKDIFPAFQKDPHILLSESNLIKVVIGHMISLSTSWADVDYVFMPLLPTNKVHWMLGAGSIKPHVNVLFALMKALGISKKDPDYNESGCK